MSYQNVCDQCRAQIKAADFHIRVHEYEGGHPLTPDPIEFCCWLCLQQYTANATGIRVGPEKKE